MLRNALFCLYLLFASAHVNAQLSEDEVAYSPRDAVEQALPAAHPSSYYLYAARRLHEGEVSDALFWLQVGQLRYRFYLNANLRGLPSGETALFEALQRMLGASVEPLVAADPDAWADQRVHAFEWDAANANGFTSKSAHAKAWQKTRAGLASPETVMPVSSSQLLAEQNQTRSAQR